MPKPLGSPKDGGRQLGTPNKDKLTLVDNIQRAVEIACGQKGFDAVLQMAIDAMTTSDKQVRMKCLAEVASYTHAKRKAVELTSDIPAAQPPTIVFAWADEVDTKAKPRVNPSPHSFDVT